MFWNLHEMSESLSRSPLVLADLTICTRMGVSSPSRARRPLANAAAVICNAKRVEQMLSLCHTYIKLNILALEGKPTPIQVQMAKPVNTNGLFLI